MGQLSNVSLIALLACAITACAIPNNALQSDEEVPDDGVVEVGERDISAGNAPSSQPVVVDYPSVGSPVEGLGPRPDDVALIVGIENYVFLPNVTKARQTAYDWEDFFRESLGLTQVYTLVDEDANREDITTYIDTVKGQADPEARLWFVYVGHGAPTKDGDDGLLVGMDARSTISSLEARSLSRRQLIEAFNDGPTDDVVMVLDACFSGQTPTGQALIEGAQPVLPAIESQGAGSALIFSAARSDQLAGPLPGAERPSFSYLLLGALRGWAVDGQGDVDAHAAHDFVDRQLRYVTSRQQTPQIEGPQDRVLIHNATESQPALRELLSPRKTASAGDPEASFSNAVSESTRTDEQRSRDEFISIGNGLRLSIGERWTITDINRDLAPSWRWHGVRFETDRGVISVQWIGDGGREFEANMETILRTHVTEDGMHLEGRQQLVGAEDNYEIGPHRGYFRNFIGEPREPSPHAQLGLSTQSFDAQWARRLGIDEFETYLGSPVVESVLAGTPAEHFGFQVGDIVRAVEGAAVVSPEELRRQIRRHDPGDTVSLSIVRDGDSMRVPVSLGASTPERAMNRWRGYYFLRSGNDLWFFSADFMANDPDLDELLGEYVELIESARFGMPK